MWFLTTAADTYDRMAHEAEVFVAQDTTKWAHEVAKDPSAGNWANFLVDSFIEGALIKVAGQGVGGSFVDVLRFGDGMREGGWGWGKDALRGLIVADAVLKVGGTIGGGAVNWLKNYEGFLSIQKAASVECNWLTGTRALKLSGQKLGMSVEKLARASGRLGFNLPALTMPGLREVLGKVGAIYQRVPAPPDAVLTALGPHLTALENLPGVMAKSPNGLMVFSIYFDELAQSMGHTLMARNTARGFQILDTGGQIYGSVQELKAVYGQTTYLLRDMTSIPYASWIEGIEAVRGSSAVLSRIGLQVKPVLDVTAYIKGHYGEIGHALSVVEAGALGIGSGEDMPQAELPEPQPKPKKPPPAKSIGWLGKLTETCVAPRIEGPPECRRFMKYHAGKGESVYSVAKAAYGDAHFWRSIFKANPDIFGIDPTKPRKPAEGQMIVVPAM